MLSDELRVMIVGDSPLARAGLASLLRSQPGIQITGQAAIDSELENAVSAYRPDVIAWDLGWEPQRALDQLADVKDILPPIVALLTDETQVQAVLSAGARAVLLQDTDAEALSAGLAAAARGLVVLTPSLLTLALPQPDSTAPPAEALTPRELEVLALLAEGLPNKTIASRLGISEHTVKFHVNAVMTKLSAQSRTDAVVRATRLGLISL